ncbi:MAG: TIGR00341 family protein, partial [Anaerolineales bacterium]
TREVLNRCDGPVILVSRYTDNNPVQRGYRRWMTWLRPMLTRAEEDEIVREARDHAIPTLDYHVLFLLSILIASLGLLLNSPAVVIGAMLVAPLVQPLMAYSVGMVTGRIPLMRRASVTVMIAALLGLLLTILLGLFLPIKVPTDQMLARGNPTVLDAGVALVSGFAAAYATARRDIPAALAGVAIAAALVPPLATAGLAIAFRSADLAFGAFSLFVMNILYISLAGWSVFFWLGMRPRTEEEQANHRQVSAAFVGLLVVPLLLIFLNLTGTATDTTTIENTLDAAFSPGEVVSVEYTPASLERGEPSRVLATLRSPRNPTRAEVRAAQDALREVTGNDRIELQIVVERVITP